MLQAKELLTLSFLALITVIVITGTAIYDKNERTPTIIGSTSEVQVVVFKECMNVNFPPVIEADLNINDTLLDLLISHGVSHPEIVYTQAVLETGWFKSSLCVNYNNLFGLYDSKNKEFYKFDSWEESVIAYRELVQYKYKTGDDYYYFLTSIGYAEDPNYIDKVKNIHNRIFNGN